MFLDPLALVLAATFIGGCMVIHAAREHAAAVTLILALTGMGLLHLISGVLVPQTTPASDPIAGHEMVSHESKAN